VSSEQLGDSKKGGKVKKNEEKSSKLQRNLLAWQKCMDLAVAIYEATTKFPKKALYGLISQIRRAAVSDPSSTSGGAVAITADQFSNFLSNAIGSLDEIDTQLEFSFSLGYLSQSNYDRLFKLLDECLCPHVWPAKIPSNEIPGE
jgi:four helix bundle protein